jgi:hypothetical protein
MEETSLTDIKYLIDNGVRALFLLIEGEEIKGVQPYQKTVIGRTKNNNMILHSWVTSFGDADMLVLRNVGCSHIQLDRERVRRIAESHNGNTDPVIEKWDLSVEPPREPWVEFFSRISGLKPAEQIRKERMKWEKLYRPWELNRRFWNLSDAQWWESKQGYLKYRDKLFPEP